MKKIEIIKILQEKQIDFDKFEEYLKNELGLGTDSRVSWIRITESEINDFIEKFQNPLPHQPPKSRSQSGDYSQSNQSSASAPVSDSSIKSETHKISPDTPNKVTLLKQQTISFELLPEKDSQTGIPLVDGFRCVLNFGKDRPPTIVPKSQGRHVSAYALFIEAIKSRLEGKDIEEAIDTVEEVVLEYVNKNSDCVGQFREYVKSRKLALKLSGIISREDRREIYQIEEAKIPAEIEALKANLEHSLTCIDQNSSTKDEMEKSLKQALDNLSSIIRLRDERDEILPSLETRNKIKRADLWRYQQCLVDTIKAGMVVLNRMEGVAFTGIKSKTSVELGSEGNRISNAMMGLRAVDPSKGLEIKNIAKQMVTLLDYPFEDIIQKAELDSKSVQIVIEEFYQVLRRHEKLCYDSFPKLKDLGVDSVNEIRKQFFTVIFQKGWNKFLNKNEKNDQQKSLSIQERLTKYSDGIELESGNFKLKEKFQAKSYTSFTEAITKLDDEAEQLQTAANLRQQGGARK